MRHTYIDTKTTYNNKNHTNEKGVKQKMLARPKQNVRKIDLPLFHNRLNNNKKKCISNQQLCHRKRQKRGVGRRGEESRTRNDTNHASN